MENKEWIIVELFPFIKRETKYIQTWMCNVALQPVKRPRKKKHTRKRRRTISRRFILSLAFHITFFGPLKVGWHFHDNLSPTIRERVPVCRPDLIRIGKRRPFSRGLFYIRSGKALRVVSLLQPFLLYFLSSTPHCGLPWTCRRQKTGLILGRINTLDFPVGIKVSFPSIHRHFSQPPSHPDQQRICPRELYRLQIWITFSVPETVHPFRLLLHRLSRFAHMWCRGKVTQTEGLDFILVSNGKPIS